MDARVAVALALLVTPVVAGCGVPADRPAPEVTAAEVPDTGERGPPNLSAGAFRPDALVAAHRRALADRSVTVRRDARLLVEGTVRSRTSAVAYHAANRSRYYVRERFRTASAGTGGRRAERWSAGRVRYSRIEYDDGTVWYGATEAGRRTPPSVEGVVGALGEVRANASGDGDLVVRALSFDRRPPSVPATARNLGVQLVVTDGGLVREVTVTYRRERGTGPRVVETLRFERVGTTEVPTPEWLATARDETDDGGGDGGVDGG